MNTSSSVPEYLYCAHFAYEDIRLAKVGATSQPKSRILQIAKNSPLEFKGANYKLFPSRHEADAWERFIIADANRFRLGSEWVLDDETLASLWSQVKGGENVDLQIAYFGRVITKAGPKQNRATAFAARFRARVGPALAKQVGYSGDPELFERAIIKARLIQGYGVEDIAVLDGIDAGVTRAEITRLRATGELSAIYRQQRGAA